jgi:DNA-binding response OmpR family regulator
MKLMLVLGSDEPAPSISACVTPLGYELIRYRYARKAMDNIDEADPAGIIISATDFPRHWKVVVQFVRSERSAETCPILLLSGKTFSADEAAKAFHIGINGIIHETLGPADIDRLTNILTTKSIIQDEAPHHPSVEAGFCVIDPVNRTLVTGTAEHLSSTGVTFTPANPALLPDIAEGEELPECSLRAGDDILSPRCRVVRAGPSLVLEFSSLSNEERGILQHTLEQHLKN